jgi:hypothetical protein
VRPAVLLLLLTVAPASSAQSVTLPVEVRGAPGTWIIIAPSAIDGGVPRWRIDPALQEVRLDLLLPPELIAQLKGKVVTGPAGVYKVEAWNAKGDVASDLAVCWITIGDGKPTPPPIPIPDPKPEPTPPPTPAKLTAIVLEESAQRTAGVAAIVGSKALRDQLAGKGHQMRVYDKDVGTGRDLLPKVVAAKIELPALVLAETSSGRIRQILPLPTTVDAVVAATLKASGE